MSKPRRYVAIERYSPQEWECRTARMLGKRNAYAALRALGMPGEGRGVHPILHVTSLPDYGPGWMQETWEVWRGADGW